MCIEIFVFSLLLVLHPSNVCVCVRVHRSRGHGDQHTLKRTMRPKKFNNRPQDDDSKHVDGGQKTGRIEVDNQDPL